MKKSGTFIKVGKQSVFQAQAHAFNIEASSNKADYKKGEKGELVLKLLLEDKEVKISADVEIADSDAFKLDDKPAKLKKELTIPFTLGKDAKAGEVKLTVKLKITDTKDPKKSALSIELPVQIVVK